MPKPKNIALACLAAALGAALIALASANVYLRSNASKARIESALGEALGMPVRIGAASVRLPASVRVQAAAIPQPDPAREGNFVEINAFDADLNLLGLLGRRFEVTSLSVASPRVAWYQDAKGRWRVPEPPREEKPEPAEKPEPTPETAPGPDRPDRPDAPEKPRKPEKAGERRGIEFAVKNIALSGGAFAFYDKNGAPVFSFDGVEARAPKASAEGVEGEVVCAEIRAIEWLRFRGARSRFAYREGAVRLGGIDAGMSGGKVRGEFAIDTAAKDSPFDAGFAFSGIDLARLAAEAGWGESVAMAGKIDGHFQGRGNGRDPEEMEGSGQILCGGAKIESFGFLLALAQAFGVKELAELQVQKAQADFRIADERVWIDQLLLDAGSLELLCWGKAKMNGKLDLEARLFLSDALLAQVPDFLESGLEPAPGRAGKSIRFDIGGTAGNPKSDLAEKLVGKKIEEQAVDLIKDLLGVPEGKKKGPDRTGE